MHAYVHRHEYMLMYVSVYVCTEFREKDGIVINLCPSFINHRSDGLLANHLFLGHSWEFVLVASATNKRGLYFEMLFGVDLTLGLLLASSEYPKRPFP